MEEEIETLDPAFINEPWVDDIDEDFYEQVLEEFRDIPWYEWYYQASNLGNIKSLFDWRHNTYRNKILKSDLCKWYYRIVLQINNIRKRFQTHRLICLTFLDNPENKKQVNHKDWNKINNRLENLEWVTQSENELHSYRVLWKKPSRANLWKFWKLHHNSKKINQHDLKWNFIKAWDSWMDVQRELWINSWNLSIHLNWKFKQMWWFIWRYPMN